MTTLRAKVMIAPQVMNLFPVLLEKKMFKKTSRTLPTKSTMMLLLKRLAKTKKLKKSKTTLKKKKLKKSSKKKSLKKNFKETKASTVKKKTKTLTLMKALMLLAATSTSTSLNLNSVFPLLLMILLEALLYLTCQLVKSNKLRKSRKKRLRKKLRKSSRKRDPRRNNRNRTDSMASPTSTKIQLMQLLPSSLMANSKHPLTLNSTKTHQLSLMIANSNPRLMTSKKPSLSSPLKRKFLLDSTLLRKL